MLAARNEKLSVGELLTVDKLALEIDDVFFLVRLKLKSRGDELDAQLDEAVLWQLLLLFTNEELFS